MIEVENTDVNIVRNLIPMRNHMPASAYGLKAISDWFVSTFHIGTFYLGASYVGMFYVGTFYIGQFYVEMLSLFSCLT